MSFLLPAAALSPILLCVSTILIFRRSALMGALFGIGLTAVLIFCSNHFPVDAGGIRVVFGKTSILVLSAALVVIPGVYFNAILRAQGVVSGIVTWVQAIRIDAELKVLILLLGILPAVESLTGFGVSLFLAIPLFFRLTPPERAFRISMLALNTVSWGSLALPTVVGASIAGYSVTELGTMSALVSSLVFPVTGLIALYVMGKSGAVRQYGSIAVLLGASLSLFLYYFNQAGFVETAGLFSGFLVSLLGFLLACMSGLRHQGPALQMVRLRSKAAIFFPYALVLGLLFATRMITPLCHWLSQLLVLSVGRVRLSVFTSPGWVMLLAMLILLTLHPVRIDHKVIWRRINIALASLCCFVFLGQLMNESHMIDAIASAIRGGQNQQGVLLLLSAMLGMTSGFIAGSNVGANALVMGMQQQIGEAAGAGLLFSALQNSAAGHAIFASLPIIVLVMTIVRDTMGEVKNDVEIAECDLLLFGIKAMSMIYVALVIAASAIFLLLA